MKVKELIEKLKEFDDELEVVTYSNCDVYGTGIIDDIALDDEYDLRTGNKTGGNWVMVDFFYDGRI